MHHDDVVLKWTNSGFLRDVRPHRARAAAERLEAAQRRSTGSGSLAALDDELQRLEREGFFSCRRAQR